MHACAESQHAPAVALRDRCWDHGRMLAVALVLCEVPELVLPDVRKEGGCQKMSKVRQ